jgi:hypothetical protein
MNAPFSFPADAGPFVWILLGLAFLALVFVVERTMFLHRGLVLSSDFIDGVRNNLKAQRPLEALAACEESPGPIPRVVKAALLRADGTEEAMSSRNCAMTLARGKSVLVNAACNNSWAKPMAKRPTCSTVYCTTT